MMPDAMRGAMLNSGSSNARTNGRTNATNVRVTHPLKTSLVLNRARVSSPIVITSIRNDWAEWQQFLHEEGLVA